MRLMDLYKDIEKQENKRMSEFYRKTLGLEHDDSYTSISNEMIDHQLNDPFVKHCEECYQNIINIVKNSPPKSTSEYLKDRNIKANVDRIDMLIKDRFGLPTKHITDNDTPYASLPVPPNMNSVLDIDTDFELLQDYARHESVGGNPKNETEYTNKTVLRFAKSARELEKRLNTKGIKIDLKKGYISGLPTSAFYCYLIFDLDSLINIIDLTAKELVAILVHEIGHLFTHIEYIYKVTAKTSVLIETVYENIVKKGKSSKETLLLLASETMPGDDVKELKDKSTGVIFISVTKNLVKLTTQPYWYTDSEQLADQFAGRLGLSNELATALSKFPKYVKKAKEKFLYYYIIPLAVGSVLSVSLVILGVGVIPFVAGAFFITFLIPAIFQYLFRAGKEIETNTAAGQTYDDTKQRINRIRLELIRRIRMCDLPKAELVNIVNQLDTITEIMNKVPDVKLGFYEKMMRFFSKSRAEIVESKELEQLIENLMENNLHVASAKLKTLI